MSDISANEASNCEMHTNRAYELKPKIVLMEHNAAYIYGSHDQTHFCGIEMQRCDAYKVENNSVAVEQITAYGTQSSQANSVEKQSCNADIVENNSIMMEHNVVSDTQGK